MGGVRKMKIHIYPKHNQNNYSDFGFSFRQKSLYRFLLVLVFYVYKWK